MIYYINAIGTTHVKVGYTKKSPRARMNQLQTGSSFPLQLLAYEDGDVAKEKTLHNHFGKTNILLEWFECDDMMLEYINNISEYFVDIVDKKIQIYKKMKM